MFVIIPALNPDFQLLDLIKQLTVHSCYKILVVDDGSTDARSRWVFEAIQKFANCTVINHSINQGKGQAIKTAFNFLDSQKISKSTGVVLADCDGQHSAEDILRVAQSLQANPQAMILGSRNKDQMPLKSKIGNQFAQFMLACITGKKLTDTQTGLRAFNLTTVSQFCNLPGKGFDFEFNCLIKFCKAPNLKIVEVPIKTIYINNNASSHFLPIRDSARILLGTLNLIYANNLSSKT